MCEQNHTCLWTPWHKIIIVLGNIVHQLFPLFLIMCLLYKGNGDRILFPYQYIIWHVGYYLKRIVASEMWFIVRAFHYFNLFSIIYRIAYHICTLRVTIIHSMIHSCVLHFICLVVYLRCFTFSPMGQKAIPHNKGYFVSQAKQV